MLVIALSAAIAVLVCLSVSLPALFFLFLSSSILSFFCTITIFTAANSDSEAMWLTTLMNNRLIGLRIQHQDLIY